MMKKIYMTPAVSVVMIQQQHMLCGSDPAKGYDNYGLNPKLFIPEDDPDESESVEEGW